MLNKIERRVGAPRTAEVAAQVPAGSRRAFLKSAATLVACTGLGLRAAHAASVDASDDKRDARILATLSRLLYPHAAVPDTRYASVADALMHKAAGDSATQALLDAGIAALDAKAGGDWLAASPGEQLTHVASIESTPFFQAVRVHTMLHLYSDAKLWTQYGYGGDAWSAGGYLRNLNDIDWLPEPKAAP